MIHVVGNVSIVDLLHHSVCIVFLVSNSPLVPASQEAVQDESKQSNRYHDRRNYYIVVAFVAKIGCDNKEKFPNNYNDKA